MQNAVIVILLPIIFGAVMALPILLSRTIRGRIGETEGTRRRMIATYGILSLAVGFMLFTRISADASLYFAAYRGGEPGPAIEGHEEAVVRELWYRQMTPPALRPSCYSDETAVCDLSDDVVAANGAAAWGWGVYLQMVGAGILAGLTSGGLAWLLTRARPGDEEKEDAEAGSGGEPTPSNT